MSIEKSVCGDASFVQFMELIYSVLQKDIFSSCELVSLSEAPVGEESVLDPSISPSRCKLINQFSTVISETIVTQQFLS